MPLDWPPDPHSSTSVGYSITVSASVCGTDSSGSIPGSRPKQGPLGGLLFWAATGRSVSSETRCANRSPIELDYEPAK